MKPPNLDGCDERLAISWRHQITFDPHERQRLRLGLFRLWQMKIHFVAVKVSVIRRTNAFVEAKCPVRHDFRVMRHDTEFVQRRLTVKQYNVAVDHVTLDDVARFEELAVILAIAVTKKLLISGDAIFDKVSTGVIVRPVADQLTHELDVNRSDFFRISHDFGDENRNGDLIDPEIRIRRDDRPTGVIHAFAAEITAKTTLLALQTLDESPGRFLGLHVERNSGGFAVDV